MQVGVVGAAVPSELVLAAGLEPVRMSGQTRATPRVDAYGFDELDPPTAAVMERLLAPGHGFGTSIPDRRRHTRSDHPVQDAPRASADRSGRVDSAICVSRPPAPPLPDHLSLQPGSAHTDMPTPRQLGRCPGDRATDSSRRRTDELNEAPVRGCGPAAACPSSSPDRRRSPSPVRRGARVLARAHAAPVARASRR